MAQFHVYRLASGVLVLDLQTDVIDAGSRVVAPVVPVGTGPRALTRLEPVLQIGGVAHVLRTAELAAIPAALLKGSPLADLTAQDYEIKRALDLVFSGF
jgi:toxin CcdB